MLKRILAISVGLASLAAALPSQGATIAYWTVPTADAAGLNADFTVGTITAGALVTSANTFVTGTTVNDPKVTPAQTSAINLQSTATFQIRLSGLNGDGLSDFILTFAADKSQANPTVNWDYSLNRGCYESFCKPLSSNGDRQQKPPCLAFSAR